MRSRLLRLFLAALVVAGAAPIQSAGASGDPTTGEEVVLGGIYSDSWEASFDLNALGAAGGKRVALAGTFHSIDESEGPGWDGTTEWQLEQAWLGRATPVANVIVSDTAASVALGSYDGAIAQWGRRVKAWLDRGERRSLLIAPLGEMNGDWVPYGLDPAAYRLAFRRFVTIFRSLGVDETQVRWVFAPNNYSTPPYRIADYYPGGDVVDLIGLSVYNWGAELGGWVPVADALGVLEELRGFAPDKPYLLTQVGSSAVGGDRDAWLGDLFRAAAADPNLVGFLYFNFDKETDWRIWDGETVTPGWAEGMALPTTRYVWPLTNWFAPGPLPFSAPLPPSRFDDTASSPFRGDIEWLAGAGVVRGCDTDSFCPDRALTRAEMAALLVRALDLPPSPDDRFTDDDTSPFQADINALAQAGITLGCTPLRFCPEQAVSRGEMAVFLVRGLGLPPSGTDRFADDDGSPYQADINSLAEAGLTIGCDLGRFCPVATVSREQVAGFLRRGLD